MQEAGNDGDRKTQDDNEFDAGNKKWEEVQMVSQGDDFEGIQKLPASVTNNTCQMQNAKHVMLCCVKSSSERIILSSGSTQTERFEFRAL